MPVWQASLDLELAGARAPNRQRRHGLIRQDTAQTLDLGRRPVRQIGQRSRRDLLAFTMTLPQQNRRRGRPIGNRGNVHADILSIYDNSVNTIMRNYMPT